MQTRFQCATRGAPVIDLRAGGRLHLRRVARPNLSRHKGPDVNCLASQSVHAGGTAMTKWNSLLYALLLAASAVCAPVPVAHAQSEGLPAIRVETREVMIPAYVLDKTHTRRDSDSEGNTIFIEEDQEITGLTARNFHVFEDGVEQHVQNVAVEPEPLWTVRDNVSHHGEYSSTPRGIWASPDAAMFILGRTGLHMYVVSYLPPPSPEGSCHRIKLKVDHRPKATVYAREEYCNVKHASSDPLNGMKVGKQMEGYADSAQGGKLPVSVQVGSFLGEAEANRVAIAVEFPWRALKLESRTCQPDASVSLLGLVHKQDGTLATRFSDAAFSQKTLNFEFGPPECPGDNFEASNLPTRYETQIDLPPGDYDLKLVLTDGAKFGRVEMPLKVDNYDRNNLGISGVVLCKRFRQSVDGPPLAPQYVPLVSKGIEFTVAGDTRFQKGEPLIAYFEVYEPQLATP